MRKISLLLAVLLLLSLAGCTSQNMKIEGRTWQLLWVDDTTYEEGKEKDSTMIACSSDYAKAFDLTDVDVLDLVATAEDGKLVITDNTAGTTYEATYTVIGQNRDPFSYSKETLYELKLGERKGTVSAYYENPRVAIPGGKSGAWVGDGYPALRMIVDNYLLTFVEEGVVREMFPEAFTE